MKTLLSILLLFISTTTAAKIQRRLVTRLLKNAFTGGQLTNMPLVVFDSGFENGGSDSGGSYDGGFDQGAGFQTAALVSDFSNSAPRTSFSGGFFGQLPTAANSNNFGFIVQQPQQPTFAISNQPSNFGFFVQQPQAEVPAFAIVASPQQFRVQNTFRSNNQDEEEIFEDDEDELEKLLEPTTSTTPAPSGYGTYYYAPSIPKGFHHGPRFVGTTTTTPSPDGPNTFPAVDSKDEPFYYVGNNHNAPALRKDGVYIYGQTATPASTNPTNAKWTLSNHFGVSLRTANGLERRLRAVRNLHRAQTYQKLMKLHQRFQM